MKNKTGPWKRIWLSPSRFYELFIRGSFAVSTKQISNFWSLILKFDEAVEQLRTNKYCFLE